MDPKINIYPESIGVKKLDKKYGLINVERIMLQGDDKDKPSTKLKATARTIVDYVNVLKGGIQFEITSKKHNVFPSIIHPKPCSKCGSLNHIHKDCHHKQICIKCTSIDHNSADCKQKPKCINCGGAHESLSELCNKIVEKTLNINSYVAEILVGEGVIARKTDILRTPRPYEEDIYSDINHKTITELIERVTETKFGHVQNDISQIKSHLSQHDKEILNMNKNINKITNDMDLVKTDISTMKSNYVKMQGDITSIVNNVDNINTKMLSNHSEIMNALRNTNKNH